MMRDDPIDDFYCFLMKGQEALTQTLRSSSGLFREAPITVIHFYDGS